MSELVSGWSDDDHVFLVYREGDAVSARRLPAMWSAFFRGMSEKDRTALARTRDVLKLEVDAHGYTRVDFRNRHARRDALYRIGEALKIRRQDVFSEKDITKFYDGAILEGDVGPLRRLLSDTPLLQIGNPRPVYLDLEVDSRKRFDDMRAGKARILAWSLYTLDGSTPRRVASAALEEDLDASERDLLRALFEALGNFDLVLSWNGDGFDFPVLEMRTQKLKVKLSTGRLPIWQRWCWLDHMEVFKKYNQAHDSGEERSSFALNAIAQHVVGQGKHDFDASKTWEEWVAGGERREAMLQYCDQDTSLMAQIEAKTGFIALHIAVCQVTRCFPDTASLGAAQQGDGFLLALGAQRGYRFPTRKSFDEREDEGAFLGAYVMTPKKIGVMDEVHVCDFAGLYPSIMRSWNMSLETYVSPGHARLADAPPLARLPDRPVQFRTDVRGIFPEALDMIVAQRAVYTKRSDDAEPGSEEWARFKRLSSAYKIIANSFYGIVGSPWTRFFDRTIAEGVTQTGAWLIKHVARVLEAAGLILIYGDTDSVFAQGAAEDFAKVVATLNTQWPATLHALGCPESRVKLEFEKSFRRLVLVSAKRYAGRYSFWKGKPAPHDMKPEIKGLEYKRGDALRLAREMQKAAIEILLDVDHPPPTVDVFHAFVEEWRTRVLEGALSVEDILLSQSVKNLGDYAMRFTSPRCTNKVQSPGTTTAKARKSCGYDFGTTTYDPEVTAKCPKCAAERKLAAFPIHVRIAKLLEARGVQVTEGTRIEYLVVGAADDEDDGKLVGVPAHDPGALERIDRNYYWDKRVFPPTQRLLEAVWPDDEWKDTAASRRKAAELLARAVEKAERKKDPTRSSADLPLFAGFTEHDPHAGETIGAFCESMNAAIAVSAAEPVTGHDAKGHTTAELVVKPPPAPKPKKARAPRPPPPAEPPLEVTCYRPDLPGDAAQAKLEQLLAALRATADAYSGRAPLTILVTDRATGEAERLDGGTVERSERARYALERIAGVGNVRDLVVQKEQGA